MTQVVSYYVLGTHFYFVWHLLVKTIAFTYRQRQSIIYVTMFLPIFDHLSSLVSILTPAFLLTTTILQIAI